MRLRARILPIFLALACACGGSITGRTEKSLRASLDAISAARDSFTTWDAQHQKALVANASSREEAEAALASYRTQRQKLIAAFTGAYSALAGGAALLPLVDAGKRSKSELVLALAEAVAAVQGVRDAIKTFQRAP
jgi:hypothetical protein